LRQGTLRYEDSSAALAFAIVFGFLAAGAFGFYWLMKPTVYKNYGVAALKPTTNTELLWSRRSDQSPAATTGYSSRDIEEKNASAPQKSDNKNREAAAAPRREHRARPQQSYPGWNYGAGRNFGFRPWF
jgi:hypothetical protein